MPGAALAEELRPGNPNAGLALIDARCETLIVLLAARLVSGSGGEASLDAHLRGHFAPDDQARADIIAYLRSKMAAP